jgi:hypothetical protein
MDSSAHETQQQYPILFRTFEIPAELVVNAESLLQWLTEQVHQLLLGDFEKLMQVLYRIDVPESAFHSAMDSPNLRTCAAHIAQAMIDRELQKAAWRNQFKQSDPSI